MSNSFLSSAPGATQSMDFSLFYFASADVDASAEKYRLLIEGAQFAERIIS